MRFARSPAAQAAPNAERRKIRLTSSELLIAFPLLLVIAFGFIEFSRIFQAHTTVQRAAEAGIAYAVSGQFDSSRYPLNPDNASPLQGMLESVVPCLPLGDVNYSDLAAQRGTSTTLTVSTGEMVTVWTGGPESLYVSWWADQDCDPADPEDQARRQDMVRLLSIMDAIRAETAGLAVISRALLPVRGPAAGDDLDLVPWYSVWAQPPAEDLQDEVGQLEVMICSTRPGVEYTPGRGVCLRRFGRTPQGPLEAVPWMDAGAPGDTVWVVVRFNHPLITPLGFAPYLPIQAERSAINGADLED